jgi:hypothetical protein
VQLSLQAAVADEAAVMARISSSSSVSGTAAATAPADTSQKPEQKQQQQQYVGRRLLQSRASYDAGGSIYTALQKESTGLYRETAGATDAASLQGNRHSYWLLLLLLLLAPNHVRVWSVGAYGWFTSCIVPPTPPFFDLCTLVLTLSYVACNVTGCHVTPAGVELDPTCPALGATVLDASHVGVDSNQVFSLPIYMLDAFGSLITRGPGSDWVLALQLPNTLGEGLSLC